MAEPAVSLEAAQNYLNDPFTGPEPVDETGPNAHFRSTFDKVQPGGAVGNTTPKASHSREGSRDHKTSPNSRIPSGGRSRGASLTQRYPGDNSHHPLAMQKKDAKAAHRSPHLRKGSIPGVDTIDALDPTPGGNYHHEGPYDATLASRNLIPPHSPVAAVAESNREALKATPRENIRNSLDKHYPLDGVGQIAPGATDSSGNRLQYEDVNMVTEAGGNYQRNPGEELDAEQKKLLRHKEERIKLDESQTSGIELTEQPKKSVAVGEHEVDEEDQGHHRHSLGGLKKRIGSLRRKKE